MRCELPYTLTQVDSVAESTRARIICALMPRFNIAGQSAPIVLVRGGDRVCDLLRWGLLPRWGDSFKNQRALAILVAERHVVLADDRERACV